VGAREAQRPQQLSASSQQQVAERRNSAGRSSLVAAPGGLQLLASAWLFVLLASLLWAGGAQVQQRAEWRQENTARPWS